MLADGMEKIALPIDEHKDEPVFAKRNETRTYKIDRPAPGRFFRLTFMPNPGVTHFQVAEIAIDGVTPRKAAAIPQDYSRTLDLATASAELNYTENGDDSSERISSVRPTRCSSRD